MVVKPNRILVFCPNWIGDAVMATPALRALRRGFPDAELVGMARPTIAQVLEGLPHLDRCYLWLPGSRRRQERTRMVLRAVRRERFDLAVLLTNSFRSAAVAWFSGARRRVGYRRDGRGWLLTDYLEPLRSGGRFVPMPVVDYYLELAYLLGCPLQGRRLELATTERDERAADAVWRCCRFGTRPVAVINPGAAYGPAKLWPAASFGQLARRMATQRGLAVLVLCGPEEQDLARQIVKRADHPAVHSLAGFELSVGLSKACVRRAALMVTTDSGPRHFAAAFDVPVVTLFGPTDRAWSETYFAKAVHLQKQVSCGPCQQRTCPTDHRCMRELKPEQVYRAAVELLDRWGGRRTRPLRRTA